MEMENTVLLLGSTTPYRNCTRCSLVRGRITWYKTNQWGCASCCCLGWKRKQTVISASPVTVRIKGNNTLNNLGYNSVLFKHVFVLSFLGLVSVTVMIQVLSLCNSLAVSSWTPARLVDVVFN